MQLRRFVGMVDLGILTVMLLAIVMPPREMHASVAISLEKPNAPENETKQEAEQRQKAHKAALDRAAFALGLAEARRISAPGDSAFSDELSRKLGELKLMDWAVEAAIDGTADAKGTPQVWRARIATSRAYIERLEARKSLVEARAAIKACTEAGEPACPSWELTRMELFRAHVEAGIEAGFVDERGRVINPKKFREAGEGKIRAIRIGK